MKITCNSNTFEKTIYMKKMLLAFDGKHFSEGAFEFARSINELNPVLLTGVFLPQVNYANLWSYADGMNGPIFIPFDEGETADTSAANVERFENLCRKTNIEYRVHKDLTDFALPGLKKESRFADLLIIGSESFYENLAQGEPNEYLKDAMHGMECPVIVVPEKYDFPKTNILSYDGSASAVYAIKQFAYLFPELTANKTLLVYAKEGIENDIPDMAFIEELAGRHFIDLTITKLDINPTKHFNAWLSEMKTAIVVSGSFGRSGLAGLFHKSFVSETIKDHRIPVFITHHK